MNKGRFAIGAIVGAVAGIIAGVLTAPKAGRETRADLKNKAAELKQGASQKVDDLRNRGEEVADDLHEKKEEVTDLGERTIRDAKQKLDK